MHSCLLAMSIDFGFVHHHLSLSLVFLQVGAELTFVLPKESAASFPAMFTALERERDSLGIESYGASVTTMEEVWFTDELKERQRFISVFWGVFSPFPASHSFLHE